MNKFSEISTKELNNKIKDLISYIETKRNKVISDLNDIEKKCYELKEFQEEIIKRNEIKT